MEALAAFALACNVIQVIDASLRSVAACYQVYKDGAPRQHLDVQEINESMRSALHCVRESLSQLPQNNCALTLAETKLDFIARKCLSVTDDLQKKLKNVTEARVRVGVRSSLKVTWRAIRGRKELEETRLSF